MKKRSVGIVISYLNTALTAVIGLVLSSFLLRKLGDTEYGLYQTVSSFVNYLVLLEFGTGTVMTRNLSLCLNNKDIKNKEQALNRNYSTVWIISLVLSVVIIIVSFIFYFNVGAIYSKTMTPDQVSYAQKILLFLFLFVFANYFTQNLNGMLLAMEEYSFPKIVMIAKLIIRMILLLTFISFWQYSIIIAAVDGLLSSLAFILSYFYSKKKYRLKFSFRYFDKAVFISSVPLCVAMLIQVVINQANSNVDKFVIGVVMSVESVALYSIVQYIFSMFSMIATIPVSMFLPEVSKNMAKKLNGKDFTKTLVNPCRLTATICGTVLFGFFAVGKQFVAVLYGVDKTEAWLLSLIILVPTFINMTNAVMLNVLDIANKRLVASLALLVTTIANIILTVYLINIWGIIGAVAATAVTLFVGNIVILNIYYYKKFGIKILYLFKAAYKGVVPCQLIAGVSAFFVGRLFNNHILGLLIGGVFYCAVCFSLYMIFGLNKDEKNQFRTLVRKIIKRK